MAPSLPNFKRRRVQATLKSFRSLDSLHKLRNIDTKFLLDTMKISVKSKFDADFRRFGITIGMGIRYPDIEEFIKLIHDLHKLTKEQRQSHTISYVSKDGTTLPISNNDNLRIALESRPSTLRILVRNKGESLEEEFGYGLSTETMQRRKKNVTVSSPQDFRRVSSILDADNLPMELRRIQICKTYSNKPLGFFIRDGYSIRLAQWGPVPTKGIFISRLVPYGLAASTNLLNVDDEVLEVNGIGIYGKSLDQVTDIMTANAANLILTTRPAVKPQYSYYPYAPPPYNIPPPGYMSPAPMQPSYQPFYNNLGYTGTENYHDEYRHMPSPGDWGSFSRESTLKLSEKMSKMSVKEAARRRPFSVHCPPAHHLYPVTPFAYYSPNH